MEDILSRLDTLAIPCLDHGSVTLEDCYPRLVPIGRGLESAVVKNARVSLDQGLKTEKEDERLVRFLLRNNHTSPFERVQFTFLIKCPRFVATHFLRHRTAKVNEFSQRYAELPEEIEYYYPSHVHTQDGKNKQQAVISDKDPAIFERLQECYNGCTEMYRELLRAGVAREQARIVIPSAVYTKLYFTMDLNNLVRFIRLRAAPSAQIETQVYAKAMLELIRPLLPIIGNEII